MKRYYSFLLALFAAVLLAAPARAYGDDAFASLPFDDLAGVTTVVTDTQGGVHRFDGALDAAALSDCPDAAAKLASYSLVYDGETLLTVALNGFEEAEETFSLLGEGFQSATNGFCSVEFDYTENDQVYTVYITGLDVEQVEEAQQQRIEALRAEIAGVGVGAFGKIDELDFVSFIDAEKLATWENNAANAKVYCGDSELCWAATTSNILYYTGWAQHAEVFQNKDDLTEDDVMDLFYNNFNDGAGHVRFGLEWFFNGNFGPDDTAKYPHGSKTNDAWARRKAGSTDGGYFPTCSPLYYYENYMADVTDTPSKSKTGSDDAQSIETALTRLREGYGVGLSMAWYEIDEKMGGYTRNGGHAVTIWGCIVKKDAAEFDKDNYAALLIGDPDSDAVNDLNPIPANYTVGTDRRTAPNKLCLMPLTSEGGQFTGSTDNGPKAVDSWWITASNVKTGVVEEFVILRPYEEDYFEDYGTFNSDTAPDLDATAAKVYLLDGEDDIKFARSTDGQSLLDARKVFSTESDLSVALWSFSNNSEAAYEKGSVTYSVRLWKPDDADFEPLTFEGGSYAFGMDALGGLLMPNGLVTGVEIAGVPIPLDELGAGTYTAQVFIDRQEGVDEAYYLNNFTPELTFTVTDDYPDLKNVSLKIVGNELWDDSEGTFCLPMTVTGLDDAGLSSAHCTAYVELLYGNGWGSPYPLVSLGNPANPDYPLYIPAGNDRFPSMRVRLLVEPEDEGAPWPVLTREVLLLKSGDVYTGPVCYPGTQEQVFYQDGSAVSEDGYFYFDRVSGVFAVWSLSWSRMVVAGYDADGRMTFCKMIGDADFLSDFGMQGIPIGDGEGELPYNTETVKVFCILKDTVTPQYEPASFVALS